MVAGEVEPYVEDGHGLADWLWALVSRDDGVRELARSVLDRMRFRGTDVRSETFSADYASSLREFGDAVRRTVDSPGFSTREYLLELTDLMRAAQAGRMALWEEQKARTDRISDRILARIKDKEAGEDVSQAFRRLMRVACASSLDPKNENSTAQTRHLLQNVAANRIFGELDRALLHAADRLREMLGDRGERHMVVKAIERIGPAAAPEFADDLFAHLDATEQPHSFGMEKALAAVIRDDPRRIAAVVDRLDSSSDGVVAGAIATLYRLGPVATQLDPRCIPRLFELASGQGGECRPSAIAALGRIGVGLDSVVGPMLEWSRDPNVWVKGASLLALGNVGRQPERVIPRLIEAFDDYDEPDPDEFYYSDHARVARALQVFGPASAPAVPALVSRLRSSEGPDRGVLETLAAIGPGAVAALPILEALASEHGLDAYDRGDAENPLALAINRIRGVE